jgi:signal transduction histidine kinase
MRSFLRRVFRARRRAEAEARRLAGINQAVLDATPDGILMVDALGNVVFANSAIQRIAELHGLRPEGRWESLTARVRDQTTDPEAYWAVMEQLQADPGLEVTHEYELENGRAFRRYTAPVKGADGSLIGRIVSIRDVTAEHDAERLKSELVATVSHELRTPLSSILGFAELLVDRTMDDEKRNRYLGTIHSEARRLTKLINDFLDLQKIEEGGFTLALNRSTWPQCCGSRWTYSRVKARRTRWRSSGRTAT